MSDERRVRAAVASIGDPKRGRLVLTVRAQGLTTRGEAAALPGYSPESTAQQLADLDQAAAALDGIVASALPATPAELQRACDTFVPAHRERSPAARFAVETALARHAAQRAAMDLASWWRTDGLCDAASCAPWTPVQTNGLLASDGAPALTAAHTTWKLKLTGSLDDDVARVALARQQLRDGATLRVDANGRYASPGELLRALALHEVAYCEQPAPAGAFWPPVEPLAAPIALDETLRDLGEAAAWFGVAPGDLRAWLDGRAESPPPVSAHPSLRAIVLKPTVLGGATICRRWAALARTAAVDAVYTHTFEGRCGFDAVHAAAAAEPDRQVAHGLAPYVLLDDPAPPPVSHALPALPDPDACYAMLDIRVAAQTHGDRIALIDADSGREWTYREAAAAVHERIVGGCQGGGGRLGAAFIGGSDVDSVLCTWAMLAVRYPILMVHPRWVETERAAWLHRVMAPVPDGIAVVIATSGTTGVRTGVGLSAPNLVAAAHSSAANLGWRPEDRWLLNLPVAHVGGLSVVTRCLLAGAAVVATRSFDAHALPELIRAHKVTLASVVPTMLHRLVEASHTAHDLPLRAVLVGGAAASVALLTRARALGWPTLATYGLTESSAQAATERLDALAAPVRPGVGPCLPGVELRVDSAGLLWVRGASVASQTHPPEPALVREDGWVLTGDYGQLDPDGRLSILSRRTELIVTGGENVYPQQVEQTLSEHPAVAAVGVVGIDDEAWGQRVVAAVVWSGAPNPDELAEWARLQLAPFARPKRYIAVDALPETTGGKLDRAGLCASLQAASSQARWM